MGKQIVEKRIETLEEKRSRRIKELNDLIEKGKAVREFEKTKMYQILVDWIKLQADYKRIFKCNKVDRDEMIGYVRFGEDILKQFEIWKQMSDKKQLELNELLK